VLVLKQRESLEAGAFQESRRVKWTRPRAKI